jgi:FAD/FMN-containing dehydrogenase
VRIEGLAARLAAIVGPAHVLEDPDVRAGYELDWTRRWRGTALLVVRPASTAQVAATLDACAAAGVTVVAQGGNTGLVGGSVPRGDAPAVVLSLGRLVQLGPVDTTAAQVAAGAGVTLAALQAHVEGSGLRFAVDLSARQSATVGGMAATNAGGIHVMRHGSMRSQVVGLEAVLASGETVSRMTGLVKDNTGYDVCGLLCGSEGTLGVITALCLRLIPERAFRLAVMVGLPGTSAALDVLAHARRLESLEAAEIMFAEGIALVGEMTGVRPPFAAGYGCVLLLEFAADEDVTDAVAAVLEHAGCPDDRLAVARAPAERARLWELRERLTEVVNVVGVPHKLDVTLPLRAIPAFADGVAELVRSVAPDARAYVWGHIGDGNLHVNVIGPDPDDDRVDAAVLQDVSARGGSISAEHGIGVAKARWLGLTRSAADIAAMYAVKRALDPSGMLNPGVLFAGGAP